MAQKSILSFFTSPKSAIKPPAEVVDSKSKSPGIKAKGKAKSPVAPKKETSKNKTEKQGSSKSPNVNGKAKSAKLKKETPKDNTEEQESSKSPAVKGKTKSVKPKKETTKDKNEKKESSEKPAVKDKAESSVKSKNEISKDKTTEMESSESPDVSDEAASSATLKEEVLEDKTEERVDLQSSGTTTPEREEAIEEKRQKSAKKAEEDHSVTVIPRRKTARKSFGSTRTKPKTNVRPLQDHFKQNGTVSVNKNKNKNYAKVSKIALSIPQLESSGADESMEVDEQESEHTMESASSQSSDDSVENSVEHKTEDSIQKPESSDEDSKLPRKRRVHSAQNLLSDSSDEDTKRPQKRKAKDSIQESESSDEDTKISKKRKVVQNHQSDSSDEEVDIPRVRKRAKKNVITDDSPVKQSTPKKAAESYVSKLNKCIFKPRESSANAESLTIDMFMKPESSKTNSNDAAEVISSETKVKTQTDKTKVKTQTDKTKVKTQTDKTKVKTETEETEVKKESSENEVKEESSENEVKKESSENDVKKESSENEVTKESTKNPIKTENEVKNEGKNKSKLAIKSENEDDKTDEHKKPDDLDQKPRINAFDVLKKGQASSITSSEKTSPSKNEKNSNKASAANTYSPSKHNYHPIEDASWKRGEKVPYLALARTFEEIENISGRLKMIEILSNFFRSVIILSPDDLLQSVYLCLNRLAPEYHNIELGVGETLLMKAVAQATGRTLENIKAEVTNKGDLGLVAESSRGNQRVMFAFPKLTISSVFTKFKEIAEMSGNTVMAKKTSKIQALFSACRECEAKYIIRSLSGKLRIGLAEQSVLSALSQAITLTPPGQEYPPEILNSSSSVSKDGFKKQLDANTLILKTTYCECPNYDLIIPILLKDGLAELPNRCQLSPGTPLKPMLAHPANSLDEVLRRFDGSEFTCEFKYDGERAQIHLLENGDVKIYSRNQEDNTTKYPDVIARLSKALAADTKSCILDSEIVAWDPEAQQIRPFQVLSTRKRKDAADSEIKVQVCILAFDLLYVNGEALVKKTLRERRDLLRKSFVEVQNEFSFVNSMDGNSTEVMQEFLEESIKGNCEGLMVKALDVAATYEIAKRSHNWLKLKKDYLEGVGDTLDLIVIGGWFGKGKRTGNYGGFLLACYDSETEEFQTICKIGTGFKDEDLEMHAKFFKEHTIPEARSYYRYDSGMEPDQWFDACQVWEVKCADLSISPIHKAASGLVDPVKGISLRFPRFLRIRDDKKPDDATSSTQVADMYNNQEQVRNQTSKDSKADALDFY